MPPPFDDETMRIISSWNMWDSYSLKPYSKTNSHVREKNWVGKCIMDFQVLILCQSGQSWINDLWGSKIAFGFWPSVTLQYVLSTYCRSLRPFHSWLRLLSPQYIQYTLSVHFTLVVNPLLTTIVHHFFSSVLAEPHKYKISCSLYGRGFSTVVLSSYLTLHVSEYSSR